MKRYERIQISPQERFLILKRDAFVCLFCGSRPGNDRLHVDHLLPSSRGGTNDHENLATTCDRCNLAKNNLILIPDGLCARATLDSEGFRTWKSFGKWEVQVADEVVLLVLLENDGVHFPIDRVFENWERHFQCKKWWTFDHQVDLAFALEFARRIFRRIDGSTEVDEW